MFSGQLCSDDGDLITCPGITVYTANTMRSDPYVTGDGASVGQAARIERTPLRRDVPGARVRT